MSVVENNTYQTVLDTVCKVTGIDEHNLFKSNKEADTDARAILVYFLSEIGFTDINISSLTGLTRQCINKLRNGFNTRNRKWSMSTNTQQIRNVIATVKFISNGI